jgi:hypothetical protein
MSGSTFFDALSDPAVGALMGAAQGFAQAAMPTRMPTPWGAALGMGAAGALAGAKNAEGLQLTNQQVQQAKINTQRGQMLLDWYKGQSPLGAPGAGGVAGAGGAPGGAPVASGNNRYLASPASLIGMGNLAFASGDPSAAATFYGQAQAPAGGPGYAMGPDGTAFSVPGGGKDPSVIATASGAAKAGELPATLAGKGWKIGSNGTLVPIQGGEADPAYQGTLAATKPVDLRVGGMHWDAVHGWVKNPERVEVTNSDGSKGFAFVSPPAPGENEVPPDPFPGWATQINKAENATGNPAATNPASTATGNGQFIDGTWPSVIRAARPDLAAGKTDEQLLALRSVPGLAQAATETYARQNGGTLAQAGLPVTAETTSLAHVLGPQGAIRVLKANPSTPLQMLLPQQVIAANPQFQGRTAGDAVQWAAQRMAGASQPPSGSHGTAEPVVMPNGQPAVAQLPPQLDAAREEAAKEFAGKDNDSFVSAQNTQAWLRQIDSAADEMTKAGSLYMTGPYAEKRYEAMRGVNDMARTIGLKEPFNPQAVASWEEMRKSTTTAGFELASHYEGHARQAAATIMNATSAVPGSENSPVGLKLVSAGIREGAQSAIDLHNYKTQIFNKTQGAGLPQAETDFYAAHPAEQYAQRAISTVHPVTITDPAQFKNYLPGTYAVLPNGKLVQVPERPDAPPVPAYLKSGAAH